MKNIFFSGVGGSGMSALAIAMNREGRKISGSDRRFDNTPDDPLALKLKAQGIELFNQDGSGVVPSLDAVIVSAAVESDTPDYSAALRQEIPVIKRPQLLASLVNCNRGICVAGTSGKSTTSSLIAYVLKEKGLDPSFIGGAEIVNYSGPDVSGNALSGASEILCVEADESDGTVTEYKPAVGTILNIQRDHHEIESLIPMFQTFTDHCRETLILNADCPVTSSGIKIPANLKTVSFSVNGADSRFRAENIAAGGFNTAFTLDGSKFEIPLPGKHNVANTLAALAVCEHLGIKRESFFEILENFRGVARRFQLVGRKRDISVIDDFAHNPDKVSAAFDTAVSMAGNGKVIAVFQPHGFGPARFFLEQMSAVMASKTSNGNIILLPEIFYAGGTVKQDISSNNIAEKVNRLGGNAKYFENRNLIPAFVGNTANEGDVVLVMGARDNTLSDFCKSILENI